MGFISGTKTYHFDALYSQNEKGGLLQFILIQFTIQRGQPDIQ